MRGNRPLADPDDHRPIGGAHRAVLAAGDRDHGGELAGDGVDGFDHADRLAALRILATESRGWARWKSRRLSRTWPWNATVPSCCQGFAQDWATAVKASAATTQNDRTAFFIDDTR